MSEEKQTLAEKFKLTFDGIIRNAGKPEKQERLKQYFKIFSGFLHDEIKAKNRGKDIPERFTFSFGKCSSQFIHKISRL
jgi:hypothetical protein